MKQGELSKLSRDCLALFQHFLRRGEKSKGKGKSKGEGEGGDVVEVAEVAGEAAYKQILAGAVAALAKNTEVEAADLRDLVVYRWLATADIAEAAAEAIAAIQGAQPPDAKKHKATGAASSAAGSASKPSIAKTAALAMFA